MGGRAPPGRLRPSGRGGALVGTLAGEGVIVRPGNVYGLGDEVISSLLRLVRSMPAVPLVGAGDQPFEPIWHEDLAQALAAAVERKDVAGRVLEISGGETTSMADVVERLSALEGRGPVPVPVPATLVKAAERVTHALGLPFPVDESKLTMLEEENVVRGRNDLRDLLGRAPTPLADGLRLLRANVPEQMPEDGVGS